MRHSMLAQMLQKGGLKDMEEMLSRFDRRYVAGAVVVVGMLWRPHLLSVTCFFFSCIIMCI